MTRLRIPATFRRQLEAYRRFYSAGLFCAIRDSLSYPDPPRKEATANTRDCRNHQVRRAEALRLESREYIRAKGTENDRTGHGFGYLWDALDLFGVINVHIDRFVAEMETIWQRADADPEVGKQFIRLMHNILIENGTSASNVYRQKQRLHLRRVA